MKLPQGMYVHITHTFVTQDEAVEYWKWLVKDGFMFMWEGLYIKGDTHMQIGYNPNLHTMDRKVDIRDIPVGTKKQKKLDQKANKQELSETQKKNSEVIREAVMKAHEWKQVSLDVSDIV